MPKDPVRPKRHKQYSKEDMSNALKAVEEDDMKIMVAAKVYGVPRKTLSDRVNGTHSSKGGPSTILTAEEEGYLVIYIQYMAKRCFPLSITQIRGFAWAIVMKSGRTKQFKGSGPSEKWWRGFKNRHANEITLRNPDNLDRGRGRMANAIVIERHFKTLKKVLEEKGIFNKPEALFNVDESGMNMECRTGKVVVKSKAKHAHSLSKGSRDHITVNCCVSASGQVLPPMIIFEKCFPSAPYVREGPINAMYCKSPNGYMDEELFTIWFKDLFIPHTNHIGNRMLIIDGHGSHININLIDAAIENNVELYCLPPHTTYLLQPLDVSVYRPLKAHFSKITDSIVLATLNQTNRVHINKTNFAIVFREAFEQTMTMKTISAGFRSCGIYLFNPDAVNKEKIMPSDSSTIETTQPTTPTSSTIQNPTETETPTTSANETEAPTTPANETEAPTTPSDTDISFTITSSASTPTNPLVLSGLIPPRLADVFITVYRQNPPSQNPPRQNPPDKTPQAKNPQHKNPQDKTPPIIIILGQNPPIFIYFSFIFGCCFVVYLVLGVSFKP